MTPTHELLPGTPKATTLKNHFGADPSDSPYGPQPTLVRTQVSTQYPDGTVKVQKASEVVFLPDGVVSDCEISLQQYYPICFNLNSCDLCAANPYCGWCASTQKCLPGKIKAATCAKACFHSWIFNINSCKNNVFGYMTNTAPEAMDLIKPEEAEPKVRVDTVITHPAVVKTPVLLGNVVTDNEVSKVDLNTGEVLGVNKLSSKQPIIGEMQQVMDVETHHQQVIGLDSGRRLDVRQPKVLHGREGFAFKEEGKK